MTKCEACGKELTDEEEIYKILGMAKKTFILVPHLYCEGCGQELIEAYKKKGKFILEQTGNRDG